ncbi:hypothetical protein K458DRAFT_440040 [Lentithecium fluviatile CBS 122367]|uniref:Uncharacterized protein n=1 Tax=Lentithecium fluviatile CBS 122367 TaxID=1168545 RepID=A0A6G1JD36_9PLEO|nr:hypothetical protein K458DRAFT_440040 [Lentithecium fluviatile CBS 122367]
MTTLSSSNINALHRQRVKGREIIVTEDPRLHLMYLSESSDCLGNHQSNICKATTGFLRTYRYLIQHESDFNIAQQDGLNLIPKDVNWASFCRFSAELCHIEDSDVSGRYRYGELRLTRLNLYAPLLLRKFHYEQVHGQYGDFFGQLYGPVLFVFAVVSIILSAMQVSIWSVCRWFSILTLMGAAVISAWFILLWLWIFLDEWIYTVRHKLEKERESRNRSRC